MSTFKPSILIRLDQTTTNDVIARTKSLQSDYSILLGQFKGEAVLVNCQANYKDLETFIDNIDFLETIQDRVLGRTEGANYFSSARTR